MSQHFSRKGFLKRTGATFVYASTLPLLTFASQAGLMAEKLITDTPAQALIAELKKSIPELMDKHHVLGLSIALIRDAKLIWSQGFDVRRNT